MAKDNMAREQIAAQLEAAFSQHGFAELSVPDLKNAAGVSLRTLYKHFPSKEAMVIGALEHRHDRYRDLLSEGSAPPGSEAITELFQRLAHWMATDAPNGCMSMSAFAAFPDNQQVNQSVKQHKLEIRQLLAQRSGREDLASDLFLLHEGASMAWPSLGQDAIHTAQRAARQLMEKPDDTD